MPAKPKPLPELGTFASVKAAADAFEVACSHYLLAKGWNPALVAPTRWLRTEPRGAQTERLIEADLIDAVMYQARYDGDLAFAERFSVPSVMRFQK